MLFFYFSPAYKFAVVPPVFAAISLTVKYTSSGDIFNFFINIKT